MEGQVGYRACVPAQSEVLRSPLGRSGVPNPNSVIHTTRRQLETIGAEGQAKNVVEVSAQRKDFLPGSRVPELDGLIQACRREAATIGAEGHAAESAHVAAQAQDLLPGMGVPNLYFRVGMHREMATDRGQATAIGAEGHRFDPVAGPAEGEQLLAGLGVPDLYRLCTSGDQPLAVGTELYTPYAVGKAT